MSDLSPSASARKQDMYDRKVLPVVQKRLREKNFSIHQKNKETENQKMMKQTSLKSLAILNDIRNENAPPSQKSPTSYADNKLNWLNAVFAYNPNGDQVNLANDDQFKNIMKTVDKFYGVKAPTDNKILNKLRAHLELKGNETYSMNHIEDEFLKIRRDNNGRGAALPPDNVVGNKPDK